MQSQRRTKNYHFVPTFLLGVFFGSVAIGTLCWTVPIAVRDHVIADLSAKIIDQAKMIDTMQNSSQ
ncbi:MAG: hypothetical protein EOO52_13605 [Gammaproteobacteria bacterium]|nr:MAG: hypothetical protein EOO52_13605 [Gammaproteobacteria bacterium]